MLDRWPLKKVVTQNRFCCTKAASNNMHRLGLSYWTDQNKLTIINNEFATNKQFTRIWGSKRVVLTVDSFIRSHMFMKHTSTCTSTTLLTFIKCINTHYIILNSKNIEVHISGNFSVRWTKMAASICTFNQLNMRYRIFVLNFNPVFFIETCNLT